MVGRAGRPQFDADGIAVIMTSEHCRKHFEQLVAGKSIIESQLHTSLVEHLNAEISMRTVDSHSQAISWLKSTFLFVRIKIEPSYYKFKSCSKENAVLEAENRLEAIFESCLDNLKQYSIVKYNGDKLTPSAYSMIMAKYYLKFETVCKFITVKPNITEPEFFDLFCSAAEFGEVRYRQDKVVLNSLACNNAIKFGVKKRVSERYEKVSVLIQVSVIDLGRFGICNSSRE